MPFNGILEAMQDLLIAGAAFEIAQIKARDIAANARAIGIRPTGSCQHLRSWHIKSDGPQILGGKLEVGVCRPGRAMS